MPRVKKEKKEEVKNLPVEEVESSPVEPVKAPKSKEPSLDEEVTVSGVNGKMHTGKFVVINGRKHLSCVGPNQTTYLVHEDPDMEGVYVV